MENLSREQKEKLYISKMTELQRRWGNPVDDDWNLEDWTDKELNEGLEQVIGQLRFEKMYKIFTYASIVIVAIVLSAVLKWFF